MSRNRIAKFLARAEELAARRRAEQGWQAARLAVLGRWSRAVPPERADAVRAALGGFVRLDAADPDAYPPALARWLDLLMMPVAGAWFPDPLPVALLDAYLANPRADVGGYQCGGCAVYIPTTPASGEVGQPSWRWPKPLFDACPHCGGAVGWFAFWNRHGGRDTLPNLGDELLAGRDPIANDPSVSQPT